MLSQPRLMFVVSPLMHRTEAYDRAAALATAKGLPLHIVAFDYIEGLATAGLVNQEALTDLRKVYVDRHHQWLEEQANSMRSNGLTVTTEVVWVEHALEEILIHLQEQPFEMLIKEVEHEPLLKRALFTPLDVHLLRECAVPLHFVCKTRNPMPRKIVAAVDVFNSDEQYEGFNDRIIHEALKLATQCKAQVHLVYAYDLSSMDAAEHGYGGGSLLFPSNLNQTLYADQAMAFSEMADRNGIATENKHMIMGNPAKVLTRFADDHDIDVVVMGRVQRRGLAKRIGSTAESLLYKMPSSVLVVTPDQGSN